MGEKREKYQNHTICVSVFLKTTKFIVFLLLLFSIIQLKSCISYILPPGQPWLLPLVSWLVFVLGVVVGLVTHTYTYTDTHTQRERERDRFTLLKDSHTLTFGHIDP
jgi:hypothetical protein